MASVRDKVLHMCGLLDLRKTALQSFQVRSLPLIRHSYPYVAFSSFCEKDENKNLNVFTLVSVLVSATANTILNLIASSLRQLKRWFICISTVWHTVVVSVLLFANGPILTSTSLVRGVS